MDIIEDVSNAIIKASTNLSEDKFNALKKLFLLKIMKMLCGL